MNVWQRSDPERRLTSEVAEPPVETSFADAQDETNFVVFEPEWLPSDCELTQCTVRPEQPPGRPDDVAAEDLGQTPWSDGNPSAVRAIVSGGDRQLRIKQFLYDWAPVAASVAPLWETPEPTPVESGDAVGWLGTDYKDNRGACVQRHRTQIEFSVLDGDFDDDELEQMLDGLSPAAPDAADTVRQIPFHTLNYWFRYGCEAPDVPHGVWEHNAVRPFGDSYAVSRMALDDAPVTPLVPDGDHFVFDSAAAFPGPDAVECVFRAPQNKSDHLWLNAAPEDSRLAPSLPPEPSDQPAETRTTVELRDTTVHYGALTEEFGAWEAFWEENGVHYAVWTSASLSLDGDAFRSVIENLVQP